MDDETMRLIGLLAISSILLVGCSTSPISAGDADPVPPSRLYAFPSNGATQLVVTRDSGMFGAGCNHRLYIDGTLAAELSSGEVARFGLAPGKHVVGVKPSSACGGGGLVETEVDMTSGESVRRRISVTLGGLAITPTAF